MLMKVDQSSLENLRPKTIFGNSVKTENKLFTFGFVRAIFTRTVAYEISSVTLTFFQICYVCTSNPRQPSVTDRPVYPD